MYLKLGTQLPYLKLGTSVDNETVLLTGTRRTGELRVNPVSWGVGTQLPYLRLGTILGTSVAAPDAGSAPAPTTTYYYGTTLIASIHTLINGVLTEVLPTYTAVIGYDEEGGSSSDDYGDDPEDEGDGW